MIRCSDEISGLDYIVIIVIVFAAFHVLKVPERIEVN